MALRSTDASIRVQGPGQGPIWESDMPDTFDGRDLSLNQFVRMVADAALSERVRKWLLYLLITF